MVDVFISYKQDEREAVTLIADALHELMLDVWFDTQLRAGGSFDEEISNALQSAKAVLVCWTPAAIKSEWVRGEATMGMRGDRLVACFLQPTDLIPPFNLAHAENLAAWAGQTDDRAWLKVLERIGELTGRPGLATYHAVSRPGASVQEMKAWTSANAGDPLAATVSARIAQLESENGRERGERERAEARAAVKLRRAQVEKSRRLARERGLRDPVRERRRMLALTLSVVALGVLSAGAAVYLWDAQDRDARLRDEVTNTTQARAFLAENGWHPIAVRAREKFARLDAELWLRADNDGSIEALQGYIADAESEPRGAYLEDAREAVDKATGVQAVQRTLSRLGYYDGEPTGARDRATRDAIVLFRYRWNLPVSEETDDALTAALATALDGWTHPRLDELRAETRDPPSEQDMARIALALGVDAASIQALLAVESGPLSAFTEDGRPIITFEPILFSIATERRYDESHPHLSSRGATRGRSQEARWLLLEEAFALDPDAALASTTWGKLQISGRNYGFVGFETVGEFARFVSRSEANQLEAALLGFIRERGLQDELRNHDWAGFARGWAGSGYERLEYDTRLARAYDAAAAAIAARNAPPAPVPAAPEPATPSPSDAAGGSAPNSDAGAPSDGD